MKCQVYHGFARWKAFGNLPLTATVQVFRNKSMAPYLTPRVVATYLHPGLVSSCMSDIHVTFGSHVEQFFDFHRAVCFRAVNQILGARQLWFEMPAAPKIEFCIFIALASLLQCQHLQHAVMLLLRQTKYFFPNSVWRCVCLKVHKISASVLHWTPLCSNADIFGT